MTPATLSLAGLLAALPAAPLAAQQDQAPTWPALDKAQDKALQKHVRLLAKEKEETRQAAQAAIRALGAGAAPTLIRRLKDNPRGNLNEQLTALLDALLEPAHAPLLGPLTKHRALAGRRYLVKKLAAFGDPATAATLAGFRKDKDIELRYYANLGLVKTSQDSAALEVVFRRTLEDWDILQFELARMLKGARSDKFDAWFDKQLKSEVSHERFTAMRLMRSLATPQSVRRLKRFLDSSVAIEKKEAIQAFRTVIDGKPPYKPRELTSFNMIKLARQWRARL